MAFTNAEKQQRHRERIKSRLQQAENKVCAEEIEAFRKDCEADVRDAQKIPGFEDYSMTDLLVSMLKGEAVELQGPFLARAMNLPTDPWPGLTYADLSRMTKGRVREARERGITTVSNGPEEVNFLAKVIAVKHRVWLEQV